jgi:hypothetical protein
MQHPYQLTTLVFDNGHLRDKPEESQRIMESLMMPMLGNCSHLNTEDRLRIVEVHDTVVQRMAIVSSPENFRLSSTFANWNLIRDHLQVQS